MNENIKRHLDSLGFVVRDKVTEFEGVVTTLSFDLYGCIQVVVTPPTGSSEKEAKWFDISRLEFISEEPVMDIPDFDKGYIAEGLKGCALKSMP